MAIDFAQRAAYWNSMVLYAENGLVRWHDTKTGESKSLLVSTSVARLNALNDMVRNSREAKLGDKRETDNERVLGVTLDRLGEFVFRGYQLCQQAREQGSPEDPEARRTAKRRMPVTMRTI